MEGSRNLYVIGIGGVSNGGKTTLCKSLTEHIKAEGIKVKVVHQDDYFKEEDQVPWHESGKFRQWDSLVAIDLPKMLDDVHSLIRQMQNYEGRSILLIEGFLIFNHKDLNFLFNRRYFLTLTKEVALERRVNRVYEPPDTDTIFQDHVWPMYVAYYNQLKNDDVALVELDGSTSPVTILEATISDVHSLMMKASTVSDIHLEAPKT